MTQHYLAGELSILLAQLQATTTDPAATTAVARLRRQAETAPLEQLGWVAVHALELAECMCWDSITHTDAGAFARQATAGADLWEFSTCAGLVDPV